MNIWNDPVHLTRGIIFFMVSRNKQISHRINSLIIKISGSPHTTIIAHKETIVVHCFQLLIPKSCMYNISSLTIKYI